MTLLAATLDAIVVERPAPSEAARQHLCLDKGYDNATGYAACQQQGYVPHIRRIGEEKMDEYQRRDTLRGDGLWSAPSPGYLAAAPFWCATTRKRSAIWPLSSWLVPSFGFADCTDYKAIFTF